MKTDTIVAVATALSDAGIGIVRVSGEEAFEIVNKLFVNKYGRHALLGYNSHTIHYGYFGYFYEKSLSNENVNDVCSLSLIHI